MEAVIRTWGNSAALRLPTSVLGEAGFLVEQTVDLVVSRGRIVVQPSQKVEYDPLMPLSVPSNASCSQKYSHAVARGRRLAMLVFLRTLGSTPKCSMITGGRLGNCATRFN